jgi:RHS repeat-associated protein
MVVTSHEYLPFGEDWITEGDTKNAPKYNSQELDKESGYYFYNARHYDPEIGRFVTPDSVIDGENSTQGWNRFAYVHNNPIRYKDPTGHAILGAMAMGALTGAAIEYGLQVGGKTIDYIASNDKNKQVSDIFIPNKKELIDIGKSAGLGALGVGIAKQLPRVGKLITAGADGVATTAVEYSQQKEGHKDFKKAAVSGVVSSANSLLGEHVAGKIFSKEAQSLAKRGINATKENLSGVPDFLFKSKQILAKDSLDKDVNSFLKKTAAAGNSISGLLNKVNDKITKAFE